MDVRLFDPFPAHAQKFLPFGMAASIEVTHKGRIWTCWAGGQDGPNAYLLASYSDHQGRSWRDPVFVIAPQAHGLMMGTRIGGCGRTARRADNPLSKTSRMKYGIRLSAQILNVYHVLGTVSGDLPQCYGLPFA